MTFYDDSLCKDAPLTEKQRKAINYFVLGKGSMAKQVVKKNNQRLKYYCPVYCESYIASDRHYVCKLCNSGKADEKFRHEITKFDPKVHKDC